MSDSNTAFELLHHGVQRWIWNRKWAALRDIQEMAIPVILAGKSDVVISAATAGGKTEAAFLPIVSRIAEDGDDCPRGFQALYVSPLRALINDQWGRLDSLCDELRIPVTKWHGDVSQSVKDRARRRPEGIMLTTPESLEAMLCRRTQQATAMFRNLRYIVIDEMHVFLDEPRGVHLRSILHRIELLAGHRICRVGLSATLADMQTACLFLRPHDPGNVQVISSEGGRGQLLMQLRGYLKHAEVAQVPGSEKKEAGAVLSPVDVEIARHIFDTMRGKRGLVFAGSRRMVETMTAALRMRADHVGVPDEFMAHHGSLSREHREDAERRLKDNSNPATIVCTTTMELGLDVGGIDSVASLGPGFRVSSIRQRLGRSGRREGQSAVLRVYVTEIGGRKRLHPIDAMRTTMVQSIAMLELMLARWNEPPQVGRLHLSTLLHQVLAIIVQDGGSTALRLWDRVSGSGAFPAVTRDMFIALLRCMGDPAVALIEQMPDGLLLPGAEGERLAASRDFFSVFVTPEEFRVVTDQGRELGTIPIEMPYVPGQIMLLGGRGWKVLEIDTERHEIRVAASRGGAPPMFGGDLPAPHDEVVARMRAVYMSLVVPEYLDATAVDLLAQGRTAFDVLGLRSSSACMHEGDVLLFPWVGDRVLNATALALHEKGCTASPTGIAISISSDGRESLIPALRELASSAPPDPIRLARRVPDAIHDKFDRYLEGDLLAATFASSALDTGRVPSVAADLLARLPQGLAPKG